MRLLNRDRSGSGSDHAEPIAERVAAKRGRHGPLRSELVLDRAALCAHLVQHRIEIPDVQVQVDRRPMSLVAAQLRAAEELLLPAAFSCMHTLMLLASRMAMVGNGRAVSTKPKTSP